MDLLKELISFNFIASFAKIFSIEIYNIYHHKAQNVNEYQIFTLLLKSQNTFSKHFSSNQLITYISLNVHLNTKIFKLNPSFFIIAKVVGRIYISSTHYQIYLQNKILEMLIWIFFIRNIPTVLGIVSDYSAKIEMKSAHWFEPNLYSLLKTSCLHKFLAI